MEFAAGLALVALVKKFVDFLKAVSNRDVNSVVTQLVSAAGAVGALLLAAQTQWANGISIGGTSLASLNVWSVVFVGVTLGSAAGVVQDVTRALNASDVAPLPLAHPLVPPLADQPAVQ